MAETFSHRFSCKEVGTIIIQGIPISIVRHNFPDSYAFYLTQARFATQFDPEITAESPASGSGPVLSDGSVPLSSGQGGYSVTTILDDHLHSTGWKSLIRRSSDTRHLQDSYEAAANIESLLNTNIRASNFNR